MIHDSLLGRPESRGEWWLFTARRHAEYQTGLAPLIILSFQALWGGTAVPLQRAARRSRCTESGHSRRNQPRRSGRCSGRDVVMVPVVVFVVNQSNVINTMGASGIK